METTLAIIVLLVILIVLAALVYAYVRASGPGAWRAWLVAPASLRQTFGSLLVSGRDTDGDGHAVRAGETESLGSGRESAGSVTLAFDETALESLRDEFERELRATRERQQELDQRLQRIDVALMEMRTMPEELTRMMRLRQRRSQRMLDQLRVELEGVRRGATAAGARRDEALADLYEHLARVEAALATVINPMLLPGESLQVPDEFGPETLEWENWDDVGEHAYAFGMSFNRVRLVLEPELAQDIERFLATLRQALTGKVYPTVRKNEPTRAQLALMRTGLEAIVEELGPVRRRLEAAWLEMERPVPRETEEIDEEIDDDE